MGFQFLNRRQATEATTPMENDGSNERFNDYFPRLFAYVHNMVGADIAAHDIVVQAFCRAFERAGSSDEERFRTVLFRTARRLCRPALNHRRTEGGETLNPREREMLALVFDAGLTRDQIARSFRIRGATVTSLLVKGLRKLRQQPSAAAARAHLEPA